MGWRKRGRCGFNFSYAWAFLTQRTARTAKKTAVSKADKHLFSKPKKNKKIIDTNCRVNTKRRPSGFFFLQNTLVGMPILLYKAVFVPWKKANIQVAVSVLRSETTVDERTATKMYFFRFTMVEHLCVKKEKGTPQTDRD